MADVKDCAHEAIDAQIAIARLDPEEGVTLPKAAHIVPVNVKCNDCGVDFRFIGLPITGNAFEGRTTPDGLDAFLPIALELAETEEKRTRWRELGRPKGN